MTTKARKAFTAEEKKEWKDEQIAKQKKLVCDAIKELSSSEGWANWIKFGRSNLRRYSFQNALLIWSQKRDAKLVHGFQQWKKEGINVKKGAKALKIFAPMFFKMRDSAGEVMIGEDGQPMKKIFYKVVNVFDVSDTDAPESTLDPMVELEGEELAEKIGALEQWATKLGYAVLYKPQSEMGTAHGYVNDRSHEIAVRKDLSGNGVVRTLIHELFHVYGNVNYTDYSREEAEVIVESATVMALGVIGFDVSKASVPYIATWGDGDIKVIEKFSKLVDVLVAEGVERLDIDWKKVNLKEKNDGRA